MRSPGQARVGWGLQLRATAQRRVGLYTKLLNHLLHKCFNYTTRRGSPTSERLQEENTLPLLQKRGRSVQAMFALNSCNRRREKDTCPLWHTLLTAKQTVGAKPRA